MARLSRRSVKTSDGVRLSLLESGHGPPIVLLPGWSQSAAMFRHQFEGLSASHRLIALDWRGHGESEKVDFGYRLSRFAMDLQDVLCACELDATAVLGHSMGNAVLWCHWEMFGRDRVRQMVIAEQPPSLLSRPEWSPAERELIGCLCDAGELMQNCESIRGADGREFRAEFVTGMLSGAISTEDRAFIIEENLRVPPAAAAALLFETSVADWRDVIRRIDLPTLICAGEGSVVPLASQRWIRDQISGARLEVFSADEGGSHFMFWESPKRFNRVVAEFLGDVLPPDQS